MSVLEGRGGEGRGGGHYWKKKLVNNCLFLNINQTYKIFSSCGKNNLLRFTNTAVHKFSKNLEATSKL
jgi:hypothetical protein